MRQFILGLAVLSLTGCATIPQIVKVAEELVGIGGKVVEDVTTGLEAAKKAVTDNLGESKPAP